MARQSQTRTAVLGALTIEPQTGYQIRQGIVEVLGHFWHESFGQIYPCLSDLLQEGLIDASPGERAGSQVYAINARGRRHLKELLSEPPADQPPRNGVLLRVFFGNSMDPSALADMLDRYEAAALLRQSAYAGIRAGLTADPGYAEHGKYWIATLRAGQLATEASITWIRETRASLLPAV